MDGRTHTPHTLTALGGFQVATSLVKCKHVIPSILPLDLENDSQAGGRGVAWGLSHCREWPGRRPRRMSTRSHPQRTVGPRSPLPRLQRSGLRTFVPTGSPAAAGVATPRSGDGVGWGGHRPARTGRQAAERPPTHPSTPDPRPGPRPSGSRWSPRRESPGAAARPSIRPSVRGGWHSEKTKRDRAPGREGGGVGGGDGGAEGGG